MNKCEIKNRLGYSDIVVVKNSSGTCVDRCAEVVETMGGRGLIVVQDDGGIIESQCGIEVKNVFVLGMERKIFNKYLKGVNDVWITYKYDLMQGNFPVIEIKFSGDPEIDLHLVHNLIRIDGKFGVSWDFFKVFFVCDVGGYNVSDCVTTASNSTYCKKSILNITGQEVLSNYIIILTVFDKINLRKNSSEFLKFLKLVLSLCDNSSNCTQQYAESLIPNLIPDPNLLDIYGQKSNSQGIYTINSIDFYWSSYLESAYCLSYYNTPESCQKCSQGCFYSDLKSGNCSIWCDNQDCGYSELVCLQQSGCYNFMLNDGNCNRDCTEDPDCLDDGQYIKVFVYTVLSCCIIIFVVFFGSSLFALCQKKDSSLLAGQIKSTCELELKSQQVEDIQVKLCPLDMTEINKIELAVITPCNHAFHLECIKNIIGDSLYLTECPCCREELKDFKVIN